MTLFIKHLQFPSPVLCSGPAGVYYMQGVELEGSAESSLVRVRAMGGGGRMQPFSVLVDSRQLEQMSNVARTGGEAELSTGDGTSVAGIDAEGHMVLRVQSLVEVVVDSLGVLVLAPGPDIPWTLGIPPESIHAFFEALADKHSDVCRCEVA